MGLPIPSNAPQITVNGSTACAAAFVLGGDSYLIGVFGLKPDGWNLTASPNYVLNYVNKGDFINDMTAKGGPVKFCEWVDGLLNEALRKYFAGANPLPPMDPKTDEEALAYVQWHLAGKKLVLVNGVPQLQ